MVERPEMAKAYDPKEVEARWYDRWIEGVSSVEEHVAARGPAYGVQVEYEELAMRRRDGHDVGTRDRVHRRQEGQLGDGMRVGRGREGIAEPNRR